MLQRLFHNGISKIIFFSGLLILGAVGLLAVIAKNQKPPEPYLANTRATTQTILPSLTSIATTTPISETKKLSPAVSNAPTSQTQAQPEPKLDSHAKTGPVADDNQPPLFLKGLGILIDTYDPATNKAGDLVFTKNKLQFNALFTEYGFTIPANQTSSGQDKRNPQPTWLAPMGTKVHSLVDGLVTNVSTLYSDDFTIMVATDTKSKWQYETEHVTNPLVKVGDRVTAGQVIAEVSPHNKDGNSGYGMVEIGILKGGNPPQHICPFAYLDPSVKDDLQKKLLAFYKAWEEYRGDTTIHNETAQSIPGCLTFDAIDG